MTFSNTILALGFVGVAAWGLYVTKTSEDRVQRYVVVVDSSNQVVMTARAGINSWTPSDGFLIKFTTDYVRYLRSRPLDVETLKFQRREVIRTSDQRLFTQLQQAMREADEQLRTSAVSVTSISANIVNRKDDLATVFVRWTEEVQGIAAKPTTYTAMIDVKHQPPLITREFEQNPTGLFVTGFQRTQEEK